MYANISMALIGLFNVVITLSFSLLPLSLAYIIVNICPVFVFINGYFIYGDKISKNNIIGKLSIVLKNFRDYSCIFRANYLHIFGINL